MKVNLLSMKSSREKSTLPQNLVHIQILAYNTFIDLETAVASGILSIAKDSMVLVEFVF